MLVKSWDPDHRMRPSFAELVIEIDSLLKAVAWRHGTSFPKKVESDKSDGGESLKDSEPSSTGRNSVSSTSAQSPKSLSTVKMKRR